MTNSQQEGINSEDEKKARKIFDDAIEAAKSAKIDVMKIFKAVVVRYAIQLKNNPNKEVTIEDVKKFYDMVAKEMQENPDLD
jgi:hypothetical protein